MNVHLENIKNLLQDSLLSDNEKQSLLKAVTDADKQWAITDFKLDRTEKVKKTTAILLEETIEELEQKRKAVEAQNKELEIETSLERVRAVAMAMRQAADLLNICKVVYHELLALGFSELRNAMINIYDDAKGSFLNYDHSGNIGGTVTDIPYNFHPLVEKQVLVTKNTQDAFFDFSFTGDELKQFRELRKNNGEVDDPRLEITDVLHYYFFSIGTGSIGISTYTDVAPEKLELLKRFRNVFDLAYKRYVDISNAELQTRVAQIELAVERVRAKALAMHSSTQILEVVTTLRNEMLGLEIPGVVAATIYLREEDDHIRMWDLSSITEMEDGFHVSLDVQFRLNETDPRLYIRKVWNNDAAYFVEKQEPPDMVVTLDWLRQYYPQQADEVKEFMATMPWKYLLHPTIQLAHGKLSVDILDQQPPAEMESIMMKMGAAFDLAYKRFLDLQQSEKQIREARIELALERIRARTMAMQHSDELAETSFLLDSQVRALGIATWGCAFNIHGEYESTEWFSSEAGAMPAYKTPMKDLFLRYYKAGESGSAIYIEKFEGEDCIAHYEYLCTLPVIGDNLKAMIEAGGSFPTRQIDHVVYFKYGYLLFITLDDAPDAHDIFIRFAKVFEQTYTRFLDLQKSEAHAVRAMHDLLEIKDARKKAEDALKELRATQAQLIQAEKMASLGELTAGIAHEIQNPLNFVNNFSELSNELIDEMNAELDKGDLTEAKAIAADVKQNLEKINHHGKRADAIVKGMLQHSQSSKGKKAPTNINLLADEYVGLAYHGLRAKDSSFNVTLQKDLDEKIGTINIIPQDIGRVLLNLITNAFYAVAEKQRSGRSGTADSGEKYNPVVSISTQKITDTVIIKVADNGNGIPKNIIDKIFQPFFTTKPTGQGTGLGLSLAYDIVKAHGGELSVETKESEGSTFIITIPTK